MNETNAKRATTFTDLPPELWDHITDYLPTASAISSLARTSKSLNAFVEKDAWKTFCRRRFPSNFLTHTTSYKDVARTLTTLSKAWDRRAFVARYVEPRRNIVTYPGKNSVDRWKRPRGQTIGFTPQLDVYEEHGSNWRQRREILAFSAGAEVCLRQTRRNNGHEETAWKTYRPYSASEGRDDVTSMHLVRPQDGVEPTAQRIITGTANGDLQCISIPSIASDRYEVDITYFATQGLPVRSSDFFQEPGQRQMLAANLDDARVALYHVDLSKTKICPLSEIEIVPPLRADGNPASGHRTWSTTFLSPLLLAVGVGPSENPLHIYSITESGLSKTPLRKYRLHDNKNIKSMSAVYRTVPLPSTASSSSDGSIFLSGAYDGIVRLHDMRSNRDVEQAYIDPADDSAIYSILPRGREQLMVGTSRHNLLKVFDLRLGAKCYSYLDASDFTEGSKVDEPNSDYNIFLRPNNTSFTARGSGWSQGRNRSAESSVYSLASPSAHSPYVYAGVENAIWSLAFTEVLDSHPDPVYFEPWSAQAEGKPGTSQRGLDSKEVHGLAMYDQDANMRLRVQRSLWETWRARAPRQAGVQFGLDERWKGANEFGS